MLLVSNNYQSNAPLFLLMASDKTGDEARMRVYRFSLTLSRGRLCCSDFSLSHSPTRGSYMIIWSPGNHTVLVATVIVVAPIDPEH